MPIPGTLKANYFTILNKTSFYKLAIENTFKHTLAIS